MLLGLRFRRSGRLNDIRPFGGVFYPRWGTAAGRGDTLRQPDLADTRCRRLAAKGVTKVFIGAITAGLPAGDGRRETQAAYGRLHDFVRIIEVVERDPIVFVLWPRARLYRVGAAAFIRWRRHCQYVEYFAVDIDLSSTRSAQRVIIVIIEADAARIP